jgi:D-aspartate ligase
MPMPVVVLNVHYSGLAIARTLGSKGHHVVGLSSTAASFGSRSRFCDFRVCPDTQAEPDRCVAFLLQLAESLPARPALFPTRDHDVLMIQAHRQVLESRFHLLYPSANIVHQILDKDALSSVAGSIGIRTPSSVTVTDWDAAQHASRHMRLPIIAKPLLASDWRRPGVWEVVGRRKAVICWSWRELEALYRAVETHNPRMMVQEFVPGGDEQLVTFGSIRTADGEIRGFTGRKLIQIPTGSGTGIAVRAERLPPVEATSRRLLDALQYVGISEVEYKIDPTTQELVLIEINPRHWDQHALGEAVGVGLSSLAVEAIEGRSLPAAEQSQKRVTWVADDGFFLAWIRNELKGGRPRSEFRHVVASEKTFAVYSGKDLGPWMGALLELASDIRAGVIARLRSTGG